ncbi:hypothetical protein [Paenibacillus albus]|uniref:Uncharacterized protein n=1 Tax=Paenibacillus albus TaxID=2495582 RepID=A0A3Q8X8S7_9BACL|nr:hypothetical protein [Paenibacillus albus]AZN43143.1 hypothetical protein EJC50_28160 [Paenibacillus albus]
MSMDKVQHWDTLVADEAMTEDYTYSNLIELVKRKDIDTIRRKYQLTVTRLRRPRFQLAVSSSTGGTRQMRLSFTWAAQRDR